MPEAITFQRDSIGAVDWAHLPNSIFSLARFTTDGSVWLVADAHKGNGRFIRMDNYDYDHASSFAEFKKLAQAFDVAGTA